MSERARVRVAISHTGPGVRRDRRLDKYKRAKHSNKLTKKHTHNTASHEVLLVNIRNLCTRHHIHENEAGNREIRSVQNNNYTWNMECIG